MMGQKRMFKEPKSGLMHALIFWGLLRGDLRTITGRKLRDERILIFGAGAAGLGIARQLRQGLQAVGVNEAERHVAVLDSRGLLVDDVAMRDAYKRELAWPAALAKASGLGDPNERTLLDVIAAFRPTAVIGASGQANSFDEAAARALVAGVERPVIFPCRIPRAMPRQGQRISSSGPMGAPW
ncbi:MAG: hypothetical protein HC809_07020 [Gammaproteobacteria bacterium]|nr:hypothetical protein [Gammaproteobacteria bacterium]